jgi:Helix-turn-helix domain
MKSNNLRNTSAYAQRKRMLDALQTLGAVNTLYARDRLNIMMPAARVKELRQQGHQILTTRITITDRNGFVHHNVARYELIQLAGGDQKCNCVYSYST